ENIIRLADGLRMGHDDTCFTIDEATVQHVILWHRLRHDVYRRFIYDSEYLSFECQLFEFIRGLLLRVTDIHEIGRLVGFSGDVGESRLTRWLKSVDPGASDVPTPLHIHVTTDKRKTARQIRLLVHDSSDMTRPLILGDDAYFVVVTLLTETALDQKESRTVV